LFLGSFLLNTQAGTYLYYFPLVCAALILFDYREQAKSLIILSVCLVSLVILHLPIELNGWRIPVSASVQTILFTCSLVTSLLVTILCVFHLIKANYYVENELTTAVSTEEELNRELVTREEELSANLEHLSKLTCEIDGEKAKLSSIVESTNHFIWSVDREYKLVYYNTRYKKLFYYRFGLEIKTGDIVTEIMPVHLVSTWKPFYDRALAGEKFSVELPGENFYKEVFFNPTVDKDKQVIGVTVFMQNINDRKEAEIQLIAAKEMAEQATKIKSDFLSNMSHEIRTPMNAVIGLTHLLLEQNPRPDQLEMLQVLRFSSENLLSLINDILDLQKIEAGKLVFEETAFPLADLLNNIIYAFKLKADEKRIELICQVDEKLPAILTGDSTRLTQILNNLLSNAIKFTETGSVQLQVRLEDESPSACTVNFAVTDTGIGIAKEKMDLIFHAFEQAELDTTRKYGGTGLGLAITKKLIELQKGSIRIESTVGVGTIFNFSIPFSRGTASVKTLFGSASLNRADLSFVRLFLVEDNQVNVMVASKFLQKWNIRVDHAENGRVALEMVQQKEYDIVLMDLQMPVMNGLEASREIRKIAGKCNSLPIIALTADVSQDVKERVTEAGMDDYLTKPFTEKTLFHIIITYCKPAEEKQPVHTAAIVSPDIEGITLNLLKVNQLAQGDQQFAHELLTACLANIHELQASYRLSMLNGNRQSLGESIHKFSSMLHILDLVALQNLLERSKYVLEEKSLGNQVHLLIEQTEEECSKISKEISRYLSEHQCTHS
jgi:PAS domain S-box-containing protein